jgi:hypothetical protein
LKTPSSEANNQELENRELRIQELGQGIGIGNYSSI